MAPVGRPTAKSLVLGRDAVRSVRLGVAAAVLFSVVFGTVGFVGGAGARRVVGRFVGGDGSRTRRR